MSVDERLRHLEEENLRLNESLQLFLDDYRAAQAPACLLRFPSLPTCFLTSVLQDDSPLRRQPSFKWAHYVKPAKSPTKPDIIESPQPSPQHPEHNTPYNRNISQPQFQSSTPTPDRPRVPVVASNDSPGSGQSSAHSRPSKQESSDNLKSFKVTLDDPTWKVLPAALKKYRINNDNWQNYAMFICYGSTGKVFHRMRFHFIIYLSAW